MSVADAAQRADAIDPTRSFCVSAPAGSGKTELLIQRYLGLLSRVERPEQVLAITFTRKAAAEMRTRVVQALQAARRNEPCAGEHTRVTRALAEQALAADARGQWQLERAVSRLNIKTIDSFCSSLTRQMPVLSHFGGQAALLDDATELYEEAVVELFGQLDQQHPVADDIAALMLHFDNNWERLQSLLVQMLARREQWRRYVGVHHTPDESEAYLVTTVAALVSEELQTLARRLAPYSAALLDLWQYAAGNLGAAVPAAFPGSQPADLAAWRDLRGMLLTQQGGWRKSVTVAQGFPPGKGEAKARKEQFGNLLAELAELDDLEQMLAGVSFLPQIQSGSESWQLLVHLSRLLPLLAAELLLVFQRRGAVDHSQVAMSALQALGEDDAPTDLALRLDYHIEHILVDEFQDTAVNQYELLRLLTRGWDAHNGQNPQAPRTIMVVGDGMQSIYGFRGANVGLFLKARMEGFNGVTLEPLELVSNFRSDAGIVDWVNDSFSEAFPDVDDINRGRVRYAPAVAVRPAGGAPAVAAHAFTGEQAVEQEINFICADIAAACADPGCDSIAVLGRSRSHLQPVMSGLRERGVPFSAQEMDSLAESVLVGDLLTLCRALANPADRLAWLALLRAPWCGLQLTDLHTLARWGDFPGLAPVPSTLVAEPLRRSLSADGRQRLEAVLPVLEWSLHKRDRLGLRAWIERTWVDLGGPATAAGSGDLADAERFLQLLERAESEGIGLDIRWLERRLEKEYMNAGEAGSKVQVMTLHKAKGLEFDRVVIPQLAKPPRPDGRQLLLWDEHSGPDGDRMFLLAADDHSARGEPTLYNYLDRQRQKKSLLEGTRLLYVGTTRAARQLLLTATLARDTRSAQLRPPSARSLLSPIWPSFSRQMVVHEEQVTTPRPAPASRLLQRLRAVAAPYPRQAPAIAPGANVPVRADNYLQRCIGTAVHLALEELSRREVLPATPLERDLLRWRAALAGMGLWGAALDAAVAALESALAATLAPDSDGRWLLRRDHPQARSEWALTVAGANDQPRDLVIDRTFVDARTGLRWLVDYKSSRPQPGEPLARFLGREAEAYREQLLSYRAALRVLGSEAIRCALFFTMLGSLYHLPELDLPAVE